jgi:hypothetical protein
MDRYWATILCEGVVTSGCSPDHGCGSLMFFAIWEVQAIAHHAITLLHREIVRAHPVLSQNRQFVWWNHAREKEHLDTPKVLFSSPNQAGRIVAASQKEKLFILEMKCPGEEGSGQDFIFLPNGSSMDLIHIIALFSTSSPRNANNIGG